MSNDSTKKIFLVAFSLCVVCSVLVSVAAVKLRPEQDANRLNDKRKNILQAAGLWEPQPGESESQTVERLFAGVTAKVVDLETGEFVEGMDPDTFNERQAARDPEASVSITRSEDVAAIGRRAKHAVVYLVGEPGNVQSLILPVYGKGLWSTMYGFLALGPDLNTVQGFSFYEHGETPGLGGEVDNPNWKGQWPGKKIFDENWEFKLKVLKGQVDMTSPFATYQVDGLAGATITSRGVENLLQYWLGEEGFGPLLTRLRQMQPQQEGENHEQQG